MTVQLGVRSTTVSISGLLREILGVLDPANLIPVVAHPQVEATAVTVQSIQGSNVTILTGALFLAARISIASVEAFFPVTAPANLIRVPAQAAAVVSVEIIL